MVVDGTEKVQQCGRIVYIEPNDLLAKDRVKYSDTLFEDNTIQDSMGGVGDNITLCNEDLTMSVDLQVIIPDRDGLSYDKSSIIVYNISSTSGERDKWASLFQGQTVNVDDNDYHILTTDYTLASYTELRKNGRGDTESLCIKSIRVKFDSHFYPVVDMVLTDVRGYALMMPSESSYKEYLAGQTGYNIDTNTKSSFFRSLFHMPCPRFMLTIKGYYGKPVTFNLCVKDFRTSFDSRTGDFNVNVNFIGYVYGLYADIPFNLLLISPYLSMGWNDTEANYNNSKASAKEKNFGKDKKGAFWNSENFVFPEKDSNGSYKEIPTFIEYLRKMTEISDIKENASGKNTKKLELCTNLMAKLKDLRESIKTYLLDRVSDSNKPKIYYDNTTYSSYFYVFTKLDRKEKDVFLNSNAYDTLKKTLEKFWNNFSVDKSPVKDYDDIKTIVSNLKVQKTMPEEKEKMEIGDDYKINTYSTYGEWEKKYNGYTDDSIKNTVKQIYYNNDNKYQYFNSDTFGSFYTSISSAVTELNNIKNTLEEEQQRDLSLITLKKLGFRPTLRNMFRIVFAHINAFTDSFYNLLANIEAHRSQRTFKELGLDIQKTDIVNCDENDMVAPFPLVYKNDENDGGISKIVYPGTDERLKDIDEVKYIDDIVKNIFMVKEGIDDALSKSSFATTDDLNSKIAALQKEIAAISGKTGTVVYNTINVTGGNGGTNYSNEPGSNVNGRKNNSKTYNFTPVLPSDYYHSSNNPYIETNKGYVYDCIITAYLRFFLINVYYNYFSTSSSKHYDAAINAEIDNFIKGCNAKVKWPTREHFRHFVNTEEYKNLFDKNKGQFICNQYFLRDKNSYSDYNETKFGNNSIPYEIISVENKNDKKNKRFSSQDPTKYNVIPMKMKFDKNGPVVHDGGFKNISSILSQFGFFNKSGYVIKLCPSFLDNKDALSNAHYGILMPVTSMFSSFKNIFNNQMVELRPSGLYGYGSNVYLPNAQQKKISGAKWIVNNNDNGVAFFESERKIYEKNKDLYCKTHFIPPISYKENPNKTDFYSIPKLLGFKDNKINKTFPDIYSMLVTEEICGSITTSIPILMTFYKYYHEHGVSVAHPHFSNLIKFIEDSNKGKSILNAFYHDTEYNTLINKYNKFGKDKKKGDFNNRILADTPLKTDSEGKADETTLLGALYNYCKTSESNKLRIRYLFDQYDVYSCCGTINRSRPNTIDNSSVYNRWKSYLDKIMECLPKKKGSNNK